MMIAEESTSWPKVTHPHRARRPRLHPQVEHGLDARHARLLRADPVHRRWHHRELTFGLLYAFTRALRPAAQPRRGRARQGQPARQDARRRLAALRQPARAVRVDVGDARRAAAVHGRRARAVDGVERRRRAAVAPARPRRATAACATCSPSSTRVAAEWPALWERDDEPTGFQWLDADDAEHSVYALPPLGSRRRGRRWPASPTSRPCPGPATGSACRGPGEWQVLLDTDSAGVRRQRLPRRRGDVVTAADPAVPWQTLETSGQLDIGPMSMVWLASTAPPATVTIHVCVRISEASLGNRDANEVGVLSGGFDEGLQALAGCAARGGRARGGAATAAPKRPPRYHGNAAPRSTRTGSACRRRAARA